MASERALATRLGIETAEVVRLIDLPSTIQRLFTSKRAPLTTEDTPADALVCAVMDSKAIADRAALLALSYKPGGRLWMIYPKRSGSIQTDISRDHGWRPLLDLGFVPVAQVAVDNDWSALRFRLAEELRIMKRKTSIGSGAPRR